MCWKAELRADHAPPTSVLALVRVLLPLCHTVVMQHLLRPCRPGGGATGACGFLPR